MNNHMHGATLVADHPPANITMTKRKGEFEACFAKGLDLSEFTTTSATTTTTTTSHSTSSGVLPTNVASSSHSARLLQIKQVEAAMKFENDQAEVKTQNLIAARVEQLKQVASKANQNRQYPLQLPAPPSHAAVKSTNETVNSDNNSSNSNSNRNMIRNVLVGMHEETIQKGYDHMPRKMLSKRHLNHHNRKSSKKPITKKNTRRKY